MSKSRIKKAEPAHRFAVYFTQEEAKKIIAFASKTGRKYSSFIRRVVLDYLNSSSAKK